MRVYRKKQYIRQRIITFKIIVYTIVLYQISLFKVIKRNRTYTRYRTFDFRNRNITISSKSNFKVKDTSKFVHPKIDMKRAGRGRGGRGGGKPANMNLITTYSSVNQQEKKQKVEAKMNNDTWENMSEIQ